MDQNQFFKCSCEQCHGHIEVPTEAAGRTIECPHCHAQTRVHPPAKAAESATSPTTPPGEKSKSWLTTFLLAYFLGGLGIDRFYNGRVGLGFGKLLTGGACGIWGLIDCFLLWRKKYKDAKGNYLMPAKRSHLAIAFATVALTLSWSVYYILVVMPPPGTASVEWHFDGEGTVTQSAGEDFSNNGADEEGGFTSLDDMFTQMKHADQQNETERPVKFLRFVVPKERPLVVMKRLETVGLKAASPDPVGTAEEDKNEAFAAMLMKHHINEKQLADWIAAAESEKIALAQKNLAGTDLIKLTEDIVAISRESRDAEKTDDQSGGNIDQNQEPTMLNMTHRQFMDEADAVIEFSDGSKRRYFFVRPNRRWFLSYTKTFSGSGGNAELITANLVQLAIIFSRKSDLLNADANRLLKGVTYDRTAPAKFEVVDEDTKVGLLSFTLPKEATNERSALDTIIDTIKQARGVSQVVNAGP